ncbi:hypothetical protein ABZ485_28425 [Streptomyces albogriseolus]|uniref:hypothetical protein n=1 Tax=Streptomyces albogriseolus TaxID=1887 RepID=UPI00345FE5D3
MSTDDSHVQHTWNLTRAADGDEIHIELWTDGYSVRVDGGDGEDSEGGKTAVDELIAKYEAAGYRQTRDYPVNDPQPAIDADAAEESTEPDGKPDACPECGSPVEFEPRYVTDVREGDAWLCTGCRWGRFVTA